MSRIRYPSTGLSDATVAAISDGIYKRGKIDEEKRLV